MVSRWLSYAAHVRQRLTVNRSFFKSAGVVAKLYGHYAFGAGRRPAAGAQQPTLAFYPQPAGPWYSIWLALQNTNIRIISNTEAADYVFIFDDSTKSDVALPSGVTGALINHRVTDISKSHVSGVFQKIFGYGVDIDPLVYTGQAVEKSEENGTHDGKIVTCPLAPELVKPAYCYQKLIDSSFTEKTSEDLRTTCVFGEIAAVFHKHKSFDKRFGTDYLSTDVRTGDEVFSEAERDLITQFCREIGLDFGAVDVMRDKHDGRIYIVDVNKTCMPVLSLPREEQLRSLAMIGEVFERRLPPLKPA